MRPVPLRVRARFPHIPIPIRALALTLILIPALMACSGGGGTVEPPATGTVSGQVTAGGTGVPGATLTLSQGATSRTATSAASGAYTFTAVAAGSWNVGAAAPTGFALAAGQAASVSVNVAGGQTATANFSLVSTLSSIRATVSVGTAPRENVTVRLYDADATTTRATQATNVSGAAVFAALPAAGYDVEVVPPSGLALGAGETAKKRVTTAAGAEASVSFTLQSAVTGPVVEVELTGMTFAPADVTIAVGTTIRWIYRNGGPHTVTPDGHSAWTEASMTTADQTFEHTFTTAGTFNYYCSPHRGSGMVGVIRVQ